MAVLLPAGTIVYLFLFKMMSFMQSRLGPDGGRPVRVACSCSPKSASGCRRKTSSRASADKRIFKMAPLIVLVSTFLLVAVVPFGPDAYFTNFDAGVFYMLAVSCISTLGILIAGWSERQQVLAARWPACRRSADRLRTADGARRARRGHPGRHDEPAEHRRAARTAARSSAGTGSATRTSSPSSSASSIFMIAVQAELTQTPFDMPIAESELVSGYMTEYSGFRFLIFFIAEFATAGVFALIASVLFLGGWGVPFSWFGWDASIDSVDNWMNVGGPLIMFTKMVVLAGHHHVGPVQLPTVPRGSAAALRVEGAHPGGARSTSWSPRS